MKLPFDFGIKLVFRLGLPGLIVALAFAPLVYAFGHSIKAELDRIEVIAVGAVFWGWAISLADMPIYMLYEGRRWWPPRVRSWFLKREQNRLAKIYSSAKDATLAKNDRRLYLEYGVKLLDFPLNKGGEPEVRFPTRLGNLITAYETYSNLKYGIDSIFYWPRLWAVLDKDLREEIDTQQAVADSGIYTSFALSLAALILIGYAIGNGVFRSRLGNVPPWWELLLLALGCFSAARGIYLLSLFAQAQFGELFKALFDQHRKKLVLDDVVEKVGSLSGDGDATKRPEAEKYQMVTRYLRWHLIRPPSEDRNYSPEDWKAELKRRAETTPTKVA
jgi:hypothetical protein